MGRSASCLAALGLCLSGCLLTIDESLIEGRSDGGGPPGGCPSGMVAIPGTDGCIDATEVSNGQYEAFVTARGRDLSGRPLPSCAFDTQNEPSADWPPSKSKNPVVFVDWCDAVAFCNYQNKELCSGDLWRRACGPDTYPYGPTYELGTCHAEINGVGNQKPKDVGTKDACVGGAPGAFDLSGNVEEWVDECAGDDCGLAGGSFLDTAAALACENRRTASRASSAATRGFRCCRP